MKRNEALLYSWARYSVWMVALSMAGCVFSELDVPVEDRYARNAQSSQADNNSAHKHTRDRVVIEERTFPDPSYQPKRSKPPLVDSSGASDTVFAPSRSNNPVHVSGGSSGKVRSSAVYSYEVPVAPKTAIKLANSDSAPSSINEKSDLRHYDVQAGDTLFSIAWRFNSDVHQLARFNGLQSPYLIYPGQRLKLLSTVNSDLQLSHSTNYGQKIAHENSELEVSYKNDNVDNKSIQKKGGNNFSNAVNLYWVWPTDGKIIREFQAPLSGATQGENSTVNKGLDIQGRFGQMVQAAAKGKVVYSGEGLLGYGKLIIIKHNEQLLSAYAHNKALLVNEGDIVKAGDTIAEIGSTGAMDHMLHFEIRKEGKPVDPLLYLPRRVSYKAED